MMHYRKEMELIDLRERLFAEMKAAIEKHKLTRHDMAALTGDYWSKDKWSLFQRGLIHWSNERFIRTARLLGVDVEHSLREVPTPALDKVLRRRAYRAAAGGAGVDPSLLD